MIIVDEILNFIEDCKEKEYVVYEETRIGYINRYLFTKKQLTEYINRHEISKFDVFKIKDAVKIKRTLEVKEDDNS